MCVQHGSKDFNWKRSSVDMFGSLSRSPVVRLSCSFADQTVGQDSVQLLQRDRAQESGRRGSMRPILLHLVVFMTLCTSSTFANTLQQPNSNTNGGGVAPLLKDVFAFWVKHGVDQQYGGFHGTLDRQGQPIAPTDKSIVQQARHLWAFSSLLRAQPETRGFSNQAIRSAADTAYTFMRDKMLKDVEGGKLFVYQTSREGKAADSRINIYGNAFAIYGLSAYALATGSSEARGLALNTFRTLDKLYHDSTNGGYNEALADFSLDSIPIQPSSNNVITEAGAAYRAGKAPLSQSFDTLLHVAEAFTELNKAVGGSDPTVTARLLQVVQLLTGPMVVKPGKAGPNTPAAYIAPNYDPRNWKPVGSPYTNYGHNIEAAWLLGDAVDELQAKGAADSGRASAMRGSLRDIGVAAVAAGYDDKNGGMFDGSTIGTAAPTSPNKIWWAQAEALLGLDWLAKQTGNTAYKSQLQQTLTFVRSHLLDKEHGEWYWMVGAGGGAPLGYSAGGVDFAGTVKGNAWKASYHTGRALLRLAQAGY